MPQCSVVLPFRDAEHTLPAALRSLEDQSLADIEILAVDDGSTDGSAGCVADFATRDPRFQLLRTPARGLVDALHTGIDAARAPLIARMDADDTCHPDRLAKQVAHLNQVPACGVISCRVAYGGDRATQAGYARHVEWANRLVTPEALRNHRFVDAPVPHPSVVFRKALLAEHGGYERGDFPEDYELWLRWWDAGVSIDKLPDTLLIWNDPPDRLSRTDPRYSPEAFDRLKATYLARMIHRMNKPVWIWGAGRKTRRRLDPLRALTPLTGYVDIDPKKIGKTLDELPVHPPENLPAPGNCLVLVYVASVGAREKIAAWLDARNYLLGADYFPVG